MTKGKVCQRGRMKRRNERRGVRGRRYVVIQKGGREEGMGVS